MSIEIIERNGLAVFKVTSPSGAVIYAKPKETNSLEVTNPQGKKGGYCVSLNGNSVRVGARGNASKFHNELRAVVTGR
jgi:hypothetical protein